jgi:hypothetical protein
LKETIDRLKPLFTDKSPVENPPKIPEKFQWVHPKLVCVSLRLPSGQPMNSCGKQPFSAVESISKVEDWPANRCDAHRAAGTLALLSAKLLELAPRYEQVGKRFIIRKLSADLV